MLRQVRRQINTQFSQRCQMFLLNLMIPSQSCLLLLIVSIAPSPFKIYLTLGVQQVGCAFLLLHIQRMFDLGCLLMTPHCGSLELTLQPIVFQFLRLLFRRAIQL